MQDLPRFAMINNLGDMPDLFQIEREVEIFVTSLKLPKLFFFQNVFVS